ncbi:flagellin [uncultured Oscillibacter sp.]|uniref:flagellin N-terminal helical domain-containing protein n=1 Tax=uncultured Oscillibacter sp. TaxID=876091 RepID=UPI00345B9783
MRIQHNILAMNAYRNYNTNTSALSKNLEKLSSGYKINRAGDDAAGLAISEKMRAQITGLNAAQKNVKDGISLVKTAEGAMQEIQDMLNRMDYLATQSANGTYDNEVDRANLQKEVDALKAEINRIADSANFNGIKLLDGKSAMATSISALGELDKEAMLDGVNPTAGGKAEITVNLGGSGASNPTSNPITASTDPTKTFDGQAPNAATADSVEFTVADIAGAQKTTSGGVTLDGTKTVQDLMDAFAGYTVTVTDAAGNAKAVSDNFATGDKVTIVSNTLGETGKTAANYVTNADGTVKFTAGVNEGDGSAATNADYKFDLDMTKLEGGQTITLNGKSITIENLATASGADGAVNINGKDLTDNATGGDAETLAGAIKTALTNQFGADFNVEVTYDAASNKASVTLTAQTAGAAGNKGELGVSTATGKNPVENIVHTIGQDAQAGTPGKLAQATFESNDLMLDNLTKVGTEFTLGTTTYRVVESNADASQNEINKDELTAAKMQELLEKNLTEPGHDSTVSYDGTTGTITFTGTETAANTLTGLTGKTIAVKNAPAAGTKAGSDANGWTGLEIEVGKTKLTDLQNHEITVDGKQVKLSDLFDITATGATADGTLTASSSLTFTAKQTGKLSDDVMKAVTYNTNASSEVRDGWDEGQTGAGNNTHYELVISTDNTKLAGGASFSFGTGDNVSTFDITYDDVETGNGTGAPGGSENEVGADRTKINLSTSMTDQEKADAIKAAVATKMDDFNVKVTVSAGSIKLEATAKEATAETNYGGVRFSSAGGAFSGGVYNAYNAFDGGTEGTYAKVSYGFDPSKLEIGDKVTIGGISINVGEKDATVKDANGKITSITISKENAQSADKLISAFESAGFQSGQLEIADGKLTITGQKTGQTAEDLAKEMGVSVSSTTRALTTGGLTLQIGDTSDSYNQLTVSIGDMHTEALGIAGIDIGNQEGASKAIQTIRDAINQVSSVRGDLGATQNRLEHTANNLSVMAENIQDAESTIRDTDIAEEMMSYTKNNILVQSAQAMLAQANAVPQGVLQLLG